MPSAPALSPVWRIPALERNQNISLFYWLSPEDGLLDGEQARDFFVKSKLAMRDLSQIWSLADFDEDGCLSLPEFLIAMHLIVAKRNGVELPESTPEGLLPCQLSSTDIPAISEAEMKAYTGAFKKLDTDSSGFLSGAVAKAVLKKSSLPVAQLAQVWSLADMDEDGQLSCQEFALCMHLLRFLRKGHLLPTSIDGHSLLATPCPVKTTAAAQPDGPTASATSTAIPEAAATATPPAAAAAEAGAAATPAQQPSVDAAPLDRKGSVSIPTRVRKSASIRVPTQPTDENSGTDSGNTNSSQSDGGGGGGEKKTSASSRRVPTKRGNRWVSFSSKRPAGFLRDSSGTAPLPSNLMETSGESSESSATLSPVHQGAWNANSNGGEEEEPPADGFLLTDENPFTNDSFASFQAREVAEQQVKIDPFADAGKGEGGDPFSSADPFHSSSDDPFGGDDMFADPFSSTAKAIGDIPSPYPSTPSVPTLATTPMMESDLFALPEEPSPAPDKQAPPPPATSFTAAFDTDPFAQLAGGGSVGKSSSSDLSGAAVASSSVADPFGGAPAAVETSFKPFGDGSPNLPHSSAIATPSGVLSPVGSDDPFATAPPSVSRHTPTPGGDAAPVASGGFGDAFGASQSQPAASTDLFASSPAPSKPSEFAPFAAEGGAQPQSSLFDEAFGGSGDAVAPVTTGGDAFGPQDSTAKPSSFDVAFASFDAQPATEKTGDGTTAKASGFDDDPFASSAGAPGSASRFDDAFGSFGAPAAAAPAPGAETGVPGPAPATSSGFDDAFGIAAPAAGTGDVSPVTRASLFDDAFAVSAGQSQAPVEAAGPASAPATSAAFAATFDDAFSRPPLTAEPAVAAMAQEASMQGSPAAGSDATAGSTFTPSPAEPAVTVAAADPTPVASGNAASDKYAVFGDIGEVAPQATKPGTGVEPAASSSPATQRPVDAPANADIGDPFTSPAHSASSAIAPASSGPPPVPPTQRSTMPVSEGQEAPSDAPATTTTAAQSQPFDFEDAFGSTTAPSAANAAAPTAAAAPAAAPTAVAPPAAPTFGGGFGDFGAFAASPTPQDAAALHPMQSASPAMEPKATPLMSTSSLGIADAPAFAASPVVGSAVPSSLEFDDFFASKSPIPSQTPGGRGSIDSAFGISSSAATSQAPSGFGSFDDAFGMSTAPSKASASSFSSNTSLPTGFDSAFTPPALQPTTGQSNAGSKPSQPEPTGFDDAFGIIPQASQRERSASGHRAVASSTSSLPPQQAQMSSFGDAFGMPQAPSRQISAPAMPSGNAPFDPFGLPTFTPATAMLGPEQGGAGAGFTPSFSPKPVASPPMTSAAADPFGGSLFGAAAPAKPATVPADDPFAGAFGGSPTIAARQAPPAIPPTTRDRSSSGTSSTQTAAFGLGFSSSVPLQPQSAGFQSQQQGSPRLGMTSPPSAELSQMQHSTAMPATAPGAFAQGGTAAAFPQASAANPASTGQLGFGDQFQPSPVPSLGTGFPSPKLQGASAIQPSPATGQQPAVGQQPAMTGSDSPQMGGSGATVVDGRQTKAKEDKKKHIEEISKSLVLDIDKEWADLMASTSPVVKRTNTSVTPAQAPVQKPSASPSLSQLRAQSVQASPATGPQPAGPASPAMSARAAVPLQPTLAPTSEPAKAFEQPSTSAFSPLHVIVPSTSTVTPAIDAGQEDILQKTISSVGDLEFIPSQKAAVPVESQGAAPGISAEEAEMARLERIRKMKTKIDAVPDFDKRHAMLEEKRLQREQEFVRKQEEEKRKQQEAANAPGASRSSQLASTWEKKVGQPSQFSMQPSARSTESEKALERRKREEDEFLRRQEEFEKEKQAREAEAQRVQRAKNEAAERKAEEEMKQREAAKAAADAASAQASQQSGVADAASAFSSGQTSNQTGKAALPRRASKQNALAQQWEQKFGSK